jgi:signal transduction histidine kinase
MRRFLPETLAGWVIVVLVSGLAIAQFVTLAVGNNLRAGTTSVLENFRVAERMADIVRLVESVPAQQRTETIGPLTSGTLRVSWGRASGVSGADTDDPRATLFSNVMQSALWNVPWRTLRVSFAPAAGAAGNAPFRRPSDRATSLGRSLDDIVAQHSRVPVLQVALQLDDESWLNFEAPFVEAPGLLTPSFVALFVLVGIVTVGLSIWSVKRLTAPLEVLARAADELGRDVHAAPLAEQGARELRQAAHAFNLMQARLQRFVQDRLQMTAAISHDLRTPITRLRLRAEFVEDEEQRRRMLADLDAMEAMIDATLAFARQDSSREAPANVDLVSLVEDLCEDRPDVTWHLGAGVESRLPFVCRPIAIRRCLANLVDNAVKYGRRADVRLEESKEGVTITVDDEGPGIPAADQERAFAPFVRLDTSRNAETGGVGLGLAIARGIARAHGGEVSLSNRAAGGLRAAITLPR